MYCGLLKEPGLISTPAHGPTHEAIGVQTERKRFRLFRTTHRHGRQKEQIFRPACGKGGDKSALLSLLLGRLVDELLEGR